MSTGMPELGSKISLISKADIRYEGRLFTVDPQECTIALSAVRSFGTEERETPFPVPAQNQVYDYILFRGSDIKDIRVLNNVQHTQPLNDPAIMQLSVPPSLGQQQFQTHPVVGHIVPTLGQFGAAYEAMGMGAMPRGLAPGMGISRDPRGLTINKPSELIIPGAEPLNVLSPTVEPLRPSDHDMIGGGSRSTTPVSLGSRKSPTNDQSVQAGGPNKKEDKKVIKPGQSNVQRQNNQRRNSREMKDNRSGGEAQENQSRPQNRQPVPRNQYNQGYQGQGYQGQGYQGQGYQGQGYHGHSYQGHHEYQQHNQANASQNNQQQRQSWGGRGPMRQRGRPRGTFRPNQSGQPNQGNKRNTLKFDNDYDFEQANTEFEELRNQLAKVKIDEGTSTTCTTKPEVNGDVDKKDDSGNETGAGETEQEEEHEVFYDKTKSFFDKISCEAVERAKGKSQRTDWRTERKLNSETFGVSATRRGNFRGRGGFRGGMGFRGGYRGNYRTPQRRDQQQGNQMEKNPQTSYNRSSSNQKPPEPLRAVLKPTLPMPAMAAK